MCELTSFVILGVGFSIVAVLGISLRARRIGLFKGGKLEMICHQASQSMSVSGAKGG